MDPVTLQAALAIGIQLTQAALDWQAKMSQPGGVTEADIDAKLAELGVSRAALAQAIADARAPKV